MELIRGQVYRLKPTTQQIADLEGTAGVTRLVYNLMLEQRRTWGQRHKLGRSTQSAEIKTLRAEFDFIAARAQTTQKHALNDLERAFQNFFARRAAYPRPRRKYLDDSFRHDGREVKVRRISRRWSEVFIPKIGWIRMRDSYGGKLAGMEKSIRTATLRRDASGWAVSFAVTCEFKVSATPLGQIGIDRGVAAPIATSAGDIYRLPAGVAHTDAAIRRAQKAMSRRKRGSRRYAKARSRFARLKARQVRRRQHMLHAVSRSIANDNGLVAIEALNISGMTRSAKGSAEEPGRNVRAKSGLNRAILASGWGSFATMLGYKLEERGGILISVDPKNTSRQCAECGHTAPENRESQAIFRCNACDHQAHADINAARNILARGINLKRRGNTPLLDAEGKALAPCEASTILSVAA
ncbi:RNA-guided endonuclease InsQ/TnpB family protein [Croceicoccus gelatinilyticus]|uniref:RNA-guided endonuclease InsQ/TnpB family protein n=1 Tax=Croceicoccus gelatinilyticus TaxID=2835536 RepID=UPI001BD12B69|nr:RNA-guided endonuclease TnpB family protein [Croceicoccus gelatinilyticus]MBS7671386.1 transposase [Croceicoccus gelatinilyticus]